MSCSPHIGTSTLHPSLGPRICPCSIEKPGAAPHRCAWAIPSCSHLPKAPAGSLDLWGRALLAGAVLGWDPPSPSYQHPKKLGRCSATGCPPASPVPVVWRRQHQWGLPSLGTGRSRGMVPIAGLQPLSCTLLPLWHPLPGAGSRTRRGDVPHSGCSRGKLEADGSCRSALTRGAARPSDGVGAGVHPPPRGLPAPQPRGSQEDWPGRPGGREVGS